MHHVIHLQGLIDYYLHDPKSRGNMFTPGGRSDMLYLFIGEEDEDKHLLYIICTYD